MIREPLVKGIRVALRDAHADEGEERRKALEEKLRQLSLIESDSSGRFIGGVHHGPPRHSQANFRKSIPAQHSRRHFAESGLCAN
jgi:hypothetical protein